MTTESENSGSLMASVLAADLAELTEELVSNAIDLPAASTMVERDFRLAVRSFLALTLTVGIGSGPPVTLTLAAGPVAVHEVASAFSLRLDSDAMTRLTVTCYAGRRDVLLELANDLVSALGVGPTALDLQPGLPAHDLVPGLHGLDRFRASFESEGARRATDY